MGDYGMKSSDFTLMSAIILYFKSFVAEGYNLMYGTTKIIKFSYTYFVTNVSIQL